MFPVEEDGCLISFVFKWTEWLLLLNLKQPDMFSSEKRLKWRKMKRSADLKMRNVIYWAAAPSKRCLRMWALQLLIKEWALNLILVKALGFAAAVASGHRGFYRVYNYIVNYSGGQNQNMKAFIFLTSVQGSLWQRWRKEKIQLFDMSWGHVPGSDLLFCGNKQSF